MFGKGAWCRPLAAPVQLLGKTDSRLMALPVLEILATGQRAVDAGRADLESVAFHDRIGEVEPLGQPPRQPLAILEGQLAGVGPLGHDLEGRVVLAADHHDAHERQPFGFHLGLDQFGQSGGIRHPDNPQAKTLPLPAPNPRGQPQQRYRCRERQWLYRRGADGGQAN